MVPRRAAPAAGRAYGNLVPRTATPGGAGRLNLHEDGERAVVDQLDVHHRAEHSGLHV